VQTIFLDTLYTEPTEVGLRVVMTDSFGTSSVQVFRDTIQVFCQRVLSTDTMIVDASLLPARTYTYKAYRLTNGQRVDSSGVHMARTMDTTSHNFIFEIDTLGDGNSSVLYDVAIVNDTLVYAVGEIYKRDSTGNFEKQPYALSIWNGRSWKLKKLYYTILSGDTIILSNIRGVLYISSSEIWFAAGSIFRWDGVSSVTQLVFSRLSLPDPYATIEKLWGASGTNLYGVGNNGTIARYDGAWQQVESGTDVDLLDVWGSPNGSTVWTCGWEDFKPTVLLQLQNNTWEKVWEESNPSTLRDDTLSGILTSVWFPTEHKLLVASHYGVYRTFDKSQGDAQRLPLPTTWPGVLLRRIRGNAVNDWLIAGTYYSIAHYNGYSWRHYEDLMSNDGRLHSADYKDNLIVAVGEFYDPVNSRGIIIRGKR
jgi:hypothetical protein